MPWDERIHSSTKGFNADGTWRKRRGVNEVFYGQVHAELTERFAPNGATTSTGANGAASSSPATVTTPTAPPPPVEGAARPLAPTPPPADQPNANTADAPPAAANAASATGNGRFSGFPEFVQAVNAIRDGGIPYLELNTYAQTLGIGGGFKDMKDQNHLWDAFFELAGGK